MSAAWRPAIRMAWRDLRRHPLRAVLTLVLVILPVATATFLSQAQSHSAWTPERNASSQLAGADAAVTVSPFAEVRARQALFGGAEPVRGAERRDPASVDLAALLPQGSRVVLAPQWRPVSFGAGGRADLIVADPTDPLVAPWFDLRSGRWPKAPDEVAVGRFAADELDLLTRAGTLRSDATLEVNDTTVRVVGLAETFEQYDEGGPGLIASPTTSLVTVPAATARQFVDLPELNRPELKNLVEDLAAVGVALQPRDVVLSPKAWGLDWGEDSFDVEPLVLGAVSVLLGGLVVVLIVGAAFGVAARRQVRDLGLLATNGGAGADVRRVVLAQGLVLGLLSSVLGGALGLGLFLLLAGTLDRWADRPVLPVEPAWTAVGVVVVLGAATAVIAALLPAWSASRLTPVQALSGRFPVRPGESKAHRGAFVLAGLGLLLVAVGGWFTARSFGPQGSEQALAPAVVALGVVLGLAGLAWATPYLVRRVAQLNTRLPLSGRYAFRDAGRQRFRTGAAVLALAATVFGVVLAGFGFASAARTEQAQAALPPQTARIYGGDPAAMLKVVDEVVPVTGSTTAYALADPERREQRVALRGGYPEIWVVQRDALEEQLAHLAPAKAEAALAAYDAGDVVLRDTWSLTRRNVVRTASGREVELVLRSRGNDVRETWQLPVTVAAAGRFVDASLPLGAAVISPETARTLGEATSLAQVPAETLVTTARPVTSADRERLAVYGLFVETDDPDRALLQRLQYAGLGVAAVLTLLVVGIAVALSAAESRDDVATLAAVGAAPRQRRAFGALHGLFLAIVGAALGLAAGAPTGMAFGQLDGLPGVDVPWPSVIGAAAVVLVLAPAAGWLVTPTRLRLTRRGG